MKDFPGNYTQYREWQKLTAKDEAQESQKKASKDASKGGAPATQGKPSASASFNAGPRRATFKEKQEFLQLEKDIERLTNEKAEIETALSSGTISVEQITEMSKRLPLLSDELDEKEMRWLELSELKM